SCATLDVSEPIGLVPDDTMSPDDRTRLADAARCWNMSTGTHLDVVPTGTYVQEVSVGFADEVCMRGANGITQPTWPIKVGICPPELHALHGEVRNEQVFTTLAHELGHVLNIRKHADDSASVMGVAPEWRDNGGFAKADDIALFDAANPDAPHAPTCRDTRV